MIAHNRYRIHILPTQIKVETKTAELMKTRREYKIESKFQNFHLEFY
jgi:hypothetical protein